MNMFEFGHISNNTILGLIIAGIIMYALIFHLDSILGEKYTKKFHNFSEECLVGCGGRKTACDITNNLRDTGYYLFDSDSDKCVVTKWELSHLVTHIFLGYFTNFHISTAVSVGFEIYEHYVYDCGSVLDLLYNFTGFIIGHKLKCGNTF